MAAVSRSYLDKELISYLSDLSSRSSTPGGGSAAALAASIAVGLNLMVINFSLDKEGKGDAWMIDVKDTQIKSMNELQLLIDEDCTVFRSLIQSLSLKADDVEEKYKAAALVPMKICRECFVSMGVSLRLSLEGNKNLLSDTVCASNILRSAFLSAKYNVRVNIKEIKDDIFRKDLAGEISYMEEGIEDMGKEVSAVVDGILGGGGECYGSVQD